VSAQRRQLGRGLAALLGEENAAPQAQTGDVDASAGAPSKGRTPNTLPVEFLRAGKFQPRKSFAPEPLDALAQSIRENGVLQPLIVRPIPGAPESYEIIAGERRWRASQLARLDEVPVIVRELTDEVALEVALVENLQRQDLSPLEEAEGYKRLMDEFSYTQEQLGQRLGKSRSHVANTLRLLALPSDVQTMVGDGSLTAGHARTLLTASDPVSLAKEIVSQGLSVRQAETKAQTLKTGVAAKKSQTAVGLSSSLGGAGGESDADTRVVERDLESKLGLRVTIRSDVNSESGSISFHFKTFDQLDDLVEKLAR